MEYLVIIILALMGYLCGLKKENRFSLVFAFLLVATQVIIGIVILGLLILIFFTTISKISNLQIGISSLFFVGIGVIAIIGVILYWIMRLILPKIKLNSTILTLSEYIIQWSLIYLTIYQVVFDNFSSDTTMKVFTQGVTTPTEIILLILPALISAWVSTIIYKLNEKML